MKLGINFAYSLQETFGVAEGLKMIKNCGFDCVDYQLSVKFKQPLEIFSKSIDEVIEYFASVKKNADEIGIFVNQTHAVFPINDGENGKATPLMIDVLKKSIIATSVLGAKYIVIHPVCFGVLCNEYEFSKACTKAIFDELLQTLIDYDVRIGVENMFSYDENHKYYCATTCSLPKDMLDHIFMMNSDRFCACLDTGHMNVIGVNPEVAIEMLGNKIELLHVHDNFGLFDDHNIPGEGIISWERVLNALKNVGYKGVFSLEIMAFDYFDGDCDMLERLCNIAYKSASALLNKYKI